MDLAQTVLQLSQIERATLQALRDGTWQTPHELAQKSQLPLDSVRRSLEWLLEKQLIQVKQNEQTILELTPLGKTALQNGLPEIRLLFWVKQHAPVALTDAKKNSGLLENEFNLALGWNKKNNFVLVSNGQLQVSGLSDEYEFQEKIEQRKDALSYFQKKDFLVDELKTEFTQRGLLSKKTILEKSAQLNDNGKQALQLLSTTSDRAYNIRDPAPQLFAGKKQPYVQFLEHIRRRLTELGFVEMDSPLVTQEFYNFDVLFQPQNHPARSWTDTYQLKQPKTGKLPLESIVKSVKAMHETGGVSASDGWQYSWNQEIARKVMPTAHTTAHTARQWVKGSQNPGKYFSIARCYRPDVVDATHLSEFNQMEGFIVGEELNFRHLLGMLKQFAVEFAGAKEVKFVPTYYPFTEPSVQLNVKHPTLGWMELGGSGLARPEILENLGINGQALMWGIGIDRLAMLKLSINDIRQLFSEDLNWLRNQPMVVP